jgi:hypothetical protein
MLEKNIVRIYNCVCPITMGKPTTMLINSAKKICDKHLGNGIWAESKFKSNYTEKCKICGGVFPPELILMEIDDLKQSSEKKMETNIMYDGKSKIPSPPEPPPVRVISEDVNIIKKADKTKRHVGNCELCGKESTSLTNCIDKKCCPTCGPLRRNARTNPEIMIDQVKDLHPELFKDDSVSIDITNLKKSNDNLNKILIEICTILRMEQDENILDVVKKRMDLIDLYVHNKPNSTNSQSEVEYLTSLLDIAIGMLENNVSGINIQTLINLKNFKN